MNLCVVAKTSIKDLVIDFIEIVNEKGETLSLNWGESSIKRVKDGFEACYKHVVSGEDEIFDMEDLSEMRVVGVGLYSDTKKVLDIDIQEMGFVDDECTKSFVAEDCYFTRNQKNTEKFLNGLQKLLKQWLKDYHYAVNTYFSIEEPCETSGLFDIAYDFKSDFEKSKLNPYSKNEKIRLMYADEFDRWYDCLIVESILPFLRRIAYESKGEKDE